MSIKDISYKDLLTTKEIWEDRLRSYEQQKLALYKLGKLDGPGEVTGIDYSSPRVQGTGQIGFFEAIEMINKIDSHIYLHKETISNIDKTIESINRKLEKLEGLELKVIYMRDIKGLQLQEIADELGYSISTVKKISMNNPKL